MSYDLRNSPTIIIFNYSTMHHGKKSIRFIGATLRNMQSNELRETMDFNTFKQPCYGMACSLKQM